MDNLTFWSQVIAAVAWPVAALAAVLILRRPLLDSLALLRRIRYKDFEASFAQEVDELKAAASDALPAAPRAPDAGPIITEHLAKLAETSPRAAIIEAWMELASAAVAALKRKGVPLPPGGSRNPLEVEQALRRSEILDDKQIVVLRHLRTLRNSAALSPELTLNSAAALEYVALARRLMGVIKAR